MAVEKKQSHLNDVGTVFEATIINETGLPENLSGATGLFIIFRKPDGTRVEKTATLVTNGMDGKIQYITVPGDLNQLKNWKWQARVETPGGKWSTDFEEFDVLPNL